MAKRIYPFFALTFWFFMLSPVTKAQRNKAMPATKYNYQTVANDPLGVKIYTLANGLKVFMSVNKTAPRIQTYIAVRTGSKNDPADATGLAHYLEHMVFKGTAKIGALDWEKEKVLLDQIAALYEQHRNTKDEAERKKIYQEIDRISGEAAKYVSANEYDRLISALGAKGTNAYTSLDQTVYVNDIPSNELEKWLQIEGERFQQVVLRLFHTELEAVFEEFNISQNRDGRKVFKEMMQALLPNHTYGTQTTIGTGEHLKNPSMYKIYEYFDTYYVPNNMAIVLSGDFDPDQAVAMVEKYFGHYKNKPVEDKPIPAQPEITQPIVREVVGKEPSSMQMIWRLPGVGTPEGFKTVLIGELVAHILYNGKAGLVDINLIQKQKVGDQSSYYCWGANDFSFFSAYGDDRPGQELEEVYKLLLGQLDLVRKGQFEDWIIEAAINNLEYSHLKRMEDNNQRADYMLDAFLYRTEWAMQAQRYEMMRKITKQQIIDFVNEYCKESNHVVVYKREGPEKVFSVEKPQITPIELQRDTSSAFKQKMDGVKSPRQKAVFLDFKTDLKTKSFAPGVKFNYVQNPLNETFELAYVIELGREHDPVLDLIQRYVPFLGTSKYNSEALQKELFKYGLDFNIMSRSDHMVIELRGLERSLDKGVELLVHILADLQPDEEAFKSLIDGMIKEMDDAKKSKGVVLNQAMYSYARYGKNSPFTLGPKKEDLLKIKAQDVVAKLKDLVNYPHEISYYGSKKMTEAQKIVAKYHKVPKTFKAVPARAKFEEVETSKDKVIFVEFKGMAQAEVMFVSKGMPKFDMQQAIYTQLYNEYFGSGLSSIVFQEIRESRALAYSTYAVNLPPSEKDRSFHYRAFVGTQVDKLKEAVPALREIIENMPVIENQILNCIEALCIKTESERIAKDDIYWNYRSQKKRGFERDTRKDMYDYYTKNSSKKILADFLQFQKEQIKNRKYTILVLGDKSKMDMNYLKSLGEFQELSLEDIFGY
jgi:predicted Zn-dependent peptidase